VLAVLALIVVTFACIMTVVAFVVGGVGGYSPPVEWAVGALLVLVLLSPASG